MKKIITALAEPQLNNELKKEKIENLIEKIKQINNEVNIVIILENKKEELEKNLYSKNVYLILYNKIEIIFAVFKD